MSAFSEVKLKAFEKNNGFAIPQILLLGVGVAPSVAFTNPIVSLSATDTAAGGSATGLSLSNVG